MSILQIKTYWSRVKGGKEQDAQPSADGRGGRIVCTAADAWLLAVEAAQVLAAAAEPADGYEDDDSGGYGGGDPLAQAAEYLRELLGLAESDMMRGLFKTPRVFPPVPAWDLAVVRGLGKARGPAHEAGHGDGDGDGDGDEEGRATEPSASGSNPYGVFVDLEDDDDDVEGEGYDDLSGEHIVYQPRPTRGMPLRRIAVRVLAALADVHGTLASRHATALPTARWREGAKEHGAAYLYVRRGQEVIDEAYAALIAREDGGGGLDEAKAKVDHEADADVIDVAAGSFSRSRDFYLRSARARIEVLQRKLREYREGKERAMQRRVDQGGGHGGGERRGFGRGRGRGGGRGSGHYAKRRIAYETELHSAEYGVQILSDMYMSAESLPEFVQAANGV